MAFVTGLVGLVQGLSVFISGLGAVGTPLLATHFEEYIPEGSPNDRD